MKTAGRYLSVVMAVLMLTMSIGITAHKMVCLVSGAVTLSFLENEGCCPDENKSCAPVKAGCCDYSTDYFRLDIQTLVSSFNFKIDLAADYFTLPVFIFPASVTTQLAEAAHSPPLLSGKGILILVSVFRI